jgi:hypothetical protein
MIRTLTTTTHDFDAFHTSALEKGKQASFNFLPHQLRDTQRDTLQELRATPLTKLSFTTIAMDKELADHNFRISPRADSFVDVAIEDTDAMDLDDAPQQTETGDDAVIKCICGFGKGYDDDDAIICDRCGTWQHTLCYFHRRPLPADDEQYLCVGCSGPRDDVDANAASSRMRRKVQTLETITARISELSCEILVRQQELHTLETEISDVISDLHFKGPLLVERATPAAWEVLDEWYSEHEYLRKEVAKTMKERDAIQQRVAELEDDGNRVKRNEPTKAEEQKARWMNLDAPPKLWTTACSLSNRPAIPHAMPPVLMMGGASGKVGKVKKKVGR